jgi:hypothetical protein
MNGILLDSRCFSTTDEAASFAVAQASVYRSL